MHPLRNIVWIYIFLILSLFGCVFSATYLAVNITVIPDRIAKVQKTSIKQEVDEEETKGVLFQSSSKGWIFGKYVPFLKKISRDLSAVTPFILLWFFGSFTWGSWKLIRDRELTKNVKREEMFPLPENYETTWIQLGFIGTLWGFLIIGFRMEQIGHTLGTDALDIMTKAFGTALLSTFTAVVMVYIIAPSAKSFYRWVIGISYEKPTHPWPNEIASQLRALSEALKATTRGVSILRGEIESLNKEISSLSFGTVIGLIEDISKKMDDQYREIQAIRTKAEKGVEKRDEIITGLKNISQSYSSFVNQLGKKLDNLTTTTKETAKEVQAGFEDAKEGIKGEISASAGSLSAQIKTMLSSYIAELKSFMENKIKTESFPLDKLNEKLDQNREAIEKEVHRIQNAVNELHSGIKRIPVGIIEKSKESKWYKFLLQLIGRK